MGCREYWTENMRGRGIPIRFSEADEDTACLCTFPGNYGRAELLDPGTVRSMALLGAAVAMASHSDLDDVVDADGGVYLPGSLPQWVVDGINAAVPGWDRDDEELADWWR